MEIAGTEEGEGGEGGLDGVEEGIEEGGGGAVAKAGAPEAEIEARFEDSMRPRPVEIEVRG